MRMNKNILLISFSLMSLLFVFGCGSNSKNVSGSDNIVSGSQTGTTGVNSSTGTSGTTTTPDGTQNGSTTIESDEYNKAELDSAFNSTTPSYESISDSQSTENDIKSAQDQVKTD